MLNMSTSLRDLLYEHSADSKVANTLINDYRTTTEFGDYLAMRGGQITYLPKGRKHELNEDGSWKRENRQEGRPAKIVRRFIRSDFSDVWLTDKDFEIFANLIKSQDISAIGDFKMVSGEDIRYWYDGNRYARNTGSLYNSCMRYEQCQPYFDIYVHNPEVCRMLVLVNKGALYGRALVWSLGDNKFYMDRIYGNDMVIEGFKDYAREQGWIHRYYNTYNHERQLVVDGKVVDKQITLQLQQYRFNSYPYMDTMKYFDPVKGTISNVHRSNSYVIANGHGEVQPRINWREVDRLAGRAPAEPQQDDRDARAMFHAAQPNAPLRPYTIRWLADQPLGGVRLEARDDETGDLLFARNVDARNVQGLNPATIIQQFRNEVNNWQRDYLNDDELEEARGAIHERVGWIQDAVRARPNETAAPDDEAF